MGTSSARSDDGINSSNGKLLVGEVQDSEGTLVLGSGGSAKERSGGGSSGELHSR